MIPIAIVGATGRGKSSSMFKEEKLKIEGLSPTDTCLINVSKKPLCIRGGDKIYPPDGTVDTGKRQFKISGGDTIAETIKALSLKKQIKNIVCDDMQYVQAFHFMNKAYEKSYDKFTEIGVNGFSPVKMAMDLTESDTLCFFMYHEEIAEKSGTRKIKTVGQMTDQYITMEGLFSIVLWAEVIPSGAGGVSYRFRTQTDGYNNAKSPYGMFEDLHIPNDLGYVAKKVREYYGIN